MNGEHQSIDQACSPLDAVSTDVTCTITIMTDKDADKAHADQAIAATPASMEDMNDEVDQFDDGGWVTALPPEDTTHDAAQQHTVASPHNAPETGSGDEEDNEQHDTASTSSSEVFVSTIKVDPTRPAADAPTAPPTMQSQETLQNASVKMHDTAHPAHPVHPTNPPVSQKQEHLTFAAALLLVQQHTASTNPTLRTLQQKLQPLCGVHPVGAGTHTLPPSGTTATTHTSVLLTALVVRHCPQPAHQQLWQLYNAATVDGLCAGVRPGHVQALVWKGTVLEERLLTRLGLMDAAVAAQALESAQRDRQQVEAAEEAARIASSTVDDEHAFVFAPVPTGKLLSAELHSTQAGQPAYQPQQKPVVVPGHPTPAVVPQRAPLRVPQRSTPASAARPQRSTSASAARPPSPAVPVSTSAAIHPASVGPLPVVEAPVLAQAPPPLPAAAAAAVVATVAPAAATVAPAAATVAPAAASAYVPSTTCPTSPSHPHVPAAQPHLPATLPAVDHDADVANAIALMPTPGEVGAGAAPPREAGVVAALEASLPDLSFMLSDTLVVKKKG